MTGGHQEIQSNAIFNDCDPILVNYEDKITNMSNHPGLNLSGTLAIYMARPPK
jgi:hypothetical protein